jgi:hypothetical protein
MKEGGLNEEKVNVIIETFADYVENYYDEDNSSEDVSSIVNDHFGEFIDWAYDDFVLSEADQEALKSNFDVELCDRIKEQVIQEFLKILTINSSV